MALVGKVVKSYLRKFPDSPSRTLAKLMFKENPALFTSEDTARKRVRYYRGQNGTAQRQAIADRTFFKEAGSRCPFEDIPEGMTDFKDWTPFRIEGERILFLSDVHVPYHDKTALTLALKYGVEQNVDTIFLNGDFLDFYALSFFEKDPRKRDFGHEVDTARKVFGIIRNAFPKAKIYFKLGNHEERYERWMRVKAPELLGVKDFELTSVLGLSDLCVTLVPGKRICKMGKLFAIHGHELSKGIAAPVNPARGFYLKAKESVIGGHHHQSSQHSEKTVGDTIISAWSVGCLCDLHPEYAPVNNWCLGFALIRVEADGSFQVENKKVLNGRIYNS